MAEEYYGIGRAGYCPNQADNTRASMLIPRKVQAAYIQQNRREIREKNSQYKK